MKFKHTKVMNFDGALRGMRNPMESWGKSDSRWKNGHRSYDIGEEDLKLAQKLIRAGSEHRKFMRQIFVSVDITAPLYWWKEFDTYKVGTVANSTSTMHKLATTPITMECFETDDYEPETLGVVDNFLPKMVEWLEVLRLQHLAAVEASKRPDNTPAAKEMYTAEAKRYWKELIRWLPESWLQTRTVTLSYENLLAMCSKGQRRFHKLTEWSEAFIGWARSLPYAQELIFIDELEVN